MSSGVPERTWGGHRKERLLGIMIPIDQTKFGKGEGNCFQACVASLLELRLDLVPHFCEGENDNWYMDLEEWLKGYNLAPLMVQVKGCPSLDHVYSIASGPAARGLKHSVVYKGNELAHDPHPDKTGIDEVEDFIFFVKADPKL